MATVLPTIPTFADDETDLSHITQLVSAVRFLVGDIRPFWHSFRTATTTISSANTWTSISMGTNAFDSEATGAGSTGILTDGIGATIRTQGVYATEACVTFVSKASAFYVGVSFLLTGGGNNPGLTLGSTKRFGMRGQQTAAQASTDVTVCCADVTPITCYPGDTIWVQGICTTSSVTINTNVSPVPAYNQGRFVTDFTGHWVRADTTSTP